MNNNGSSEQDSPVDLESPFILRIPPEPARVLRETIRNNNSLKDRVTVKIENDMRHGEVRVDNWVMPGKIVDLPTVVKSLKTIDGKQFYKTADICQMFICKYEEDQTTDEDSPQKTKKKDANKVEKKYLWPHGITPPTKNVRKRRFRKTLRKKYVEAPEVEREVKRLLRSDNDAVNVKWEVINEDDDNKVNKGTVVKKEPPESNTESHVAEHDIFGGAVSDSDEEDHHLNVLDLEENSQNSLEDSHFTDSSSAINPSMGTKLLTEFTSDMFREMQNIPLLQYYQQPSTSSYPELSPSASKKIQTKVDVETRIEELQLELAELKVKRQQQEIKLETIENIALRQRFQEILDELLQQQMEKEQEMYDLQLRRTFK